MDFYKELSENFWLFISAILTFITIILGIKTLQFQKIVAEKQGVFQSPNIQLNLYYMGWRVIDADNSIPYNILIATKIPKNGTILFPLLISLTNDGSKTGREIHLLLKYHKTLHQCCLDVENPVIKFDQNMKGNPPKYWKSGDFQFIYINVGTIIPKQSFSFVDEISINDSTLSKKFNVDVVSKDNIPFKVSAEFSFAHNIEYTIFQDDSNPIAGSITIQILDTSQKSLVNHIRFENARNKKKYDNSSLYQKIKMFGNYKKTGKDKESMLAVTCDETKIEYAAKGQIGRISASDLEYICYSEDITGQNYRISGEGGRIVGPYLE